MKPFLKWAGGKRQLIPYIKEYINNDILTENVKFYEPFLGGGSLFFELSRSNCIINDVNFEIINVYRAIKEHPIGLLRMLKSHENNDSNEYYYQIREMDKLESYKNMGKVKKAARTIYLNRTCFNGLYRVNMSGHFNTPRGKYDNPLICDKKNIMEISEFLNNNNIEILNEDFEDACPNVSEGDFIYFDPPYDYENEDGFVSYNAQGFTREDLKRLKKFCDTLIEKGCNVLISNNDTTFVRETFNDSKYEIVYQINEVPASRNINSIAEKRSKKVKEVLIYGTKK